MKLFIMHCVHCGRIYIFDDETGTDICLCGCELYPVCRKFSLGELKLADGFIARVK